MNLLPADFPAPVFPPTLAPEHWNEASDTRLLSSNLDFAPLKPMVSDAPDDDGLLFAILTLVTAGAGWQFYTSNVYRRLYHALYGPLNQY